jgi:acetyltransferase-like isoleucine patch superfamily enzyme
MHLCIIGANSVAIQDVPSFCVVAGNPVRVIKK